MRLATYKDLCMDASETSVAGAFWSTTLGLSIEQMGDGDTRLSGPTPAHSVWIDHVPEPKTVKHRVHLDVHGGSVDDLTALGATVLDDTSFRWVVMADPEGGEFCLFLRDDVPAYRLDDIVVDSHDHLAAATWWANVLGGSVGGPADRGFSWVASIPNAPFDGLVFVPVPEPKTCKNRLHIDVTAPDVQPLLDAGATLLRGRDDEIDWNVLADPEGNEFCVFDSP